MANESVFKKKERIRKPRVHISYEVFVGDSIQLKELPFVVGVLSDLSGKPKEPLKGLKEREFLDIDRDNFDDVLQRLKPRLDFKVKNTAASDDSQLHIELEFEKLDDFRPEQIVQQVDPLKQLLDLRNQLRELVEKADNPLVEERLQAIIENVNGVRDKLKTALPATDAAGGTSGAGSAPAEDEGVK